MNISKFSNNEVKIREQVIKKLNDNINLLDYKIDYKREQNFFFYKGYKYCLCNEIINNKLTETFYNIRESNA